MMTENTFHPYVEAQKALRTAQATKFALDMRNMNKGTQIEQNLKSTVLRSLMAKYKLTIHEAR